MLGCGFYCLYCIVLFQKLSITIFFQFVKYFLLSVFNSHTRLLARSASAPSGPLEQKDAIVKQEPALGNGQAQDLIRDDRMESEKDKTVAVDTSAHAPTRQQAVCVFCYGSSTLQRIID